MALVDVADLVRPAVSGGTIGANKDGEPNDSIRNVALAGWLIIAVFFGGMGTWAVT